MKILVTGSAGYIGGTFSFEALRRGHEVIGVDNFSNSTKKISNALFDEENARKAGMDTLDDLSETIDSLIKDKNLCKSVVYSYCDNLIKYEK